jgi:acetyl-CoA synthetase
MGGPLQNNRQELLAERTWSVEQVWAAAERRLDRPVSEGLNTAHEACDRWARDRSRIAIIVAHPGGGREQWTFAELARASSRLATAWRKAGLKRGDRVAAVLGQQIEAYICALAAWRSGLIYMPLYVGFGPDALAQRLGNAEASAIVVDHRYRANVENALAALSHEPQIYTVVGNRGRGAHRGDRVLWAEIDRSAAEGAIVNTAPDEPATLMYTSGTTGSPKGCVMPHSTLLTGQPVVRHVYGLSGADMLFTGGNPGWSYGLYATGAAVMALGYPRVIYTGDFDPRDWLRVIVEEEATYIAAAPTAHRRLAQAARHGGIPACVRGASCGGEPLDEPLVTAWKALTGASIQDTYGLSETGILLANLAYDNVVPGALSSVLPGFEVALVDENGQPQDDEGIIAVRRPKYQASIGYWNAQHLWDARWRGEWFLSGDRARRDSDGNWWFVGRDDDVIVTSGYNVGPTEVENVLLAHPGVADAAVVASPDADRGSVVRAVLVANGTVTYDQITTEIKQAVRDKIGKHASPRLVDFVDALPRTETGKVRRNVLRQDAAT